MKAFYFLMVVAIFSCTPKDKTVDNNNIPSDSPIEKYQVSLTTLYEGTRQKLFNTRVSDLKNNLDRMDALDPVQNKKELLYSAALKHYEDVLKGPLAADTIAVIENSNIKTPSENLKITKIFKPIIISTPDYMKYFEQHSTLEDFFNTHGYGPSFKLSDYMVTFLDFANASLGGGLFIGGLVQEETIFLLCPEMPLYVSGSGHGVDLIREPELTKPEYKNYITRITTKINPSSPRPKYLTNIICNVGFKGDYDKQASKQMKNWDLKNNLDKYFSFTLNPSPVNFLALAVTDVSKRTDKTYSYEIVEDFFNNVYKAFELVLEHNKVKNPGKKNIIFGGPLGAGVFGHSEDFSAAMQILVARLLGVDILVLTGTKDLVRQDAEAEIDKLLATVPLGAKFDTMLKAFLEQVKNINYFKMK